MRKIEFPNLNGLRFFAAFGVLLHHVEQIKSIYGLPNLWDDPGVLRLGGLCVSLFFVLSGFLITYLLLEEAHVFNSVSVSKFYIRRALRIWPLYYIVVILGFAILPAITYFNVPGYVRVWNPGWQRVLIAYLLLSAQLGEVWFRHVAYAGVLWSVGVEEWFYLVWPWILKFARRWIVWISLGIIVGLHLLRVHISRPPAGDFLRMLRFDCMAFGALFAVTLRSKDSTCIRWALKVLFSVEAQLLLYGALSIGLIRGLSSEYYDEILYSVAFGLVILNLAGNPRSLLRLETPALHWLGNLSYGLYCYNWITGVAAVKISKVLFVGHRGHAAVAAHIFATVFCVLLSGLSYEFVERRFLLLKQRGFTRVANMPATTLHVTPETN